MFGFRDGKNPHLKLLSCCYFRNDNILPKKLLLMEVDGEEVDSSEIDFSGSSFEG